MLRATDKLAEAEFFLDKLKQTKGEGQEFRYYLSALLSATRSITLVLQKDLRSTHGSLFEEWWTEKKKVILTTPLSFETIRDLRNVFQKEGDRLLNVLTLKEKEGVHLLLDPSLGLENGGITLCIHGREQQTEQRAPIIAQREGEPDAEFRQRAESEIEKRLRFLSDNLLNICYMLEWELLGFSLIEEYDKGSPPLSFYSLIEGFTAYLSAIRNIVEEAESTFIKQSSP